MENRGTPCPAQGIARHQTQQQSFRGYPAGQPPDVGHVSEGLNPLLKLEVAKILLHDIRHGHAQPSREIPRGHHLLFFGIVQ